ncbi:MAG: NAD(P)-dependent oxidoreductase [Actinobacteria bacterium]|nr:NAD(P)-dependent oxidoreductase [Actinomycetota bacterium]
MESDATAPLSAYGQSKRAGEIAVLESGAKALVLRSSWLVSAHGQNFAATMLRLACTKTQLRVVADQYGVPTPTAFLSEQIKSALFQTRTFPQGLFHLVPAGETNWHQYAIHVVQKAETNSRWQAHLKIHSSAIEAIASEAFPSPVARPLNARLDCSRWKQALGLSSLPDYREVLEPVIDQMLERGPDFALKR